MPIKRSCVVVSHIQRIGCQLERTILYTVANPARGLLLNREKRGRKRSVAAPRRCSCGGNNKFNFINTHAQRERERERERDLQTHKSDARIQIKAIYYSRAFWCGVSVCVSLKKNLNAS